MAKPQSFGDNWDSLCNDHDANHSVKLWLSARLRSYQRGCIGVESAHTKELPKGRHLGSNLNPTVECAVVDRQSVEGLICT